MVKVRYGAGARVVMISGEEFDLNAMNGRQFLDFQKMFRKAVRAWLGQ